MLMFPHEGDEGCVAMEKLINAVASGVNDLHDSCHVILSSPGRILAAVALLHLV